jgi:hypothetical protein
MRWLPILLLGCGGEPTPLAKDVVAPFSNNVRRYAVTSVTLPQDRLHEAADLNGDGKPDNQLGNIVGLLASNHNAVRNADDLIATGVLQSLVEIAADDLVEGTAGIRLLGREGDASDFTGGRFGQFTLGYFHSNRAANTTHPATMTVRLPLFIDVDPLVIQVRGVQIDLIPNGSGFDGQLNGVVRQGDVAALTVMGTLAMIAADPYDHPQVDQIFDTNMDGVITDQEVLDNPIIKNVTYPDVAMFDRDGNWAPDPNNRYKSASSIGVGIHLEPCDSGSCVNAQPVESCHDRALDGDESDVDCGGSCRTCLDGFACKSDNDCHSGSCHSGVCAGTSCSDLKVDGDESDLDCGGSCPVKCAQGRLCHTIDDCMPGLACLGTPKRCI